MITVNVLDASAVLSHERDVSRRGVGTRGIDVGAELGPAAITGILSESISSDHLYVLVRQKLH